MRVKIARGRGVGGWWRRVVELRRGRWREVGEMRKSTRYILLTDDEDEDNTNKKEKLGNALRSDHH